MTLTQILQKIRSVFYTKSESDTLLSNKANVSDIPSKTSELTNDSGFITDISGKSVDYIDSQGDGWIRYTNGIQICWGEETVSTNTETAKTFPKSFIDANYCIVTTAATWALFSNSYRKNTGAFSVYVYHTTSKECSVYWQAIGKWK